MSHILLLLALSTAVSVTGYEIVSPFIASNSCKWQYGDCDVDTCGFYTGKQQDGCFPRLSVSTCPDKKTFYFPQQYDYRSYVRSTGSCYRGDRYRWCCKACPKGSKFYQESKTAKYCVKCDSNAVVYKHRNLKGVTCVVAPSFVQKLNRFINGLKTLSVSANATACGRRTTDATCHDGSDNDDFRIGQAIDLTMYRGKTVFLRNPCGDPAKLSIIEKKILNEAKSAGLIWGGSYSKTKCNHFEVTGPDPKLHNTPEYKNKINVFQKALESLCTKQCGLEPTKGQNCLCKPASNVATACPMGLIPCYGKSGKKCVNVTADSANCGGCYNLCLGDTRCSAGKCQCKPGLSLCNDYFCANTTTDPDNCGTCGNECYLGESSVSPRGNCTSSKCGCLPGYTLCGGGFCLNTKEDSLNCGKCNNQCPDITECTNGKCTKCPSGRELCSNECVDKTTNPSNCGACGKVCPLNYKCTNSKCTKCPPGQELCKYECVNKATDQSNCGVCGKACPLNGECANGKCACLHGSALCDKTECKNIKLDNENCGKCGNACPFQGLCAEGKCLCPQQYTLCKNSCANLKTDFGSCGKCGNMCPDGAQCVNGKCICPQGSVPCDKTACDQFFPEGSCNKTQCVYIKTDRYNCGKCGSVCPDGSECVNGKCSTCPRSFPTLCNVRYSCSDDKNPCTALSCTSTKTNIANCGKCGNVCPLHSTCVNGKCTCSHTVCKYESRPCLFFPCFKFNKVCTNTSGTDKANCGRCGNFCPGYSTCINGKCTTNIGSKPDTNPNPAANYAAGLTPASAQDTKSVKAVASCNGEKLQCP